MVIPSKIESLNISNDYKVILSLICDNLEYIIVKYMDEDAKGSERPAGFEKPSYGFSDAFEADAAEFIRSPEAFSFRRAVRPIGEIIYRYGGDTAMSAVLDEVTERIGAVDEHRGSWAEDLLDKRWNGIGSWLA